MNTLIHFKRWACSIDDSEVTAANAKLHALKLLKARSDAGKKAAKTRGVSDDPKKVKAREKMREWRKKCNT